MILGVRGCPTVTPWHANDALMQVKAALKYVQLDDKSSNIEARHQLDIGLSLYFTGNSLGLKLGQWCRWNQPSESSSLQA